MQIAFDLFSRCQFVDQHGTQCAYRAIRCDDKAKKKHWLCAEHYNLAHHISCAYQKSALAKPEVRDD